MLEFTLPVLESDASLQDALETMVDHRCSGVIVRTKQEAKILHVNDMMEALKPSQFHGHANALQQAIQKFSLESVDTFQRAELYESDTPMAELPNAFARAAFRFAPHKTLLTVARIWSSSENLGARYLTKPSVASCYGTPPASHYYPPYTPDPANPGMCFCGKAIR